MYLCESQKWDLEHEVLRLGVEVSVRRAPHRYRHTVRHQLAVGRPSPARMYEVACDDPTPDLPERTQPLRPLRTAY